MIQSMSGETDMVNVERNASRVTHKIKQFHMDGSDEDAGLTNSSHAIDRKYILHVHYIGQIIYPV